MGWLFIYRKGAPLIAQCTQSILHPLWSWWFPKLAFRKLGLVFSMSEVALVSSSALSTSFLTKTCWVDSGDWMRHLPAWGMSGYRGFFRTALSAWISVVQIKKPTFGVLDVTFLLFLWYYPSKGCFPQGCLSRLPFWSKLHFLRFRACKMHLGQHRGSSSISVPIVWSEQEGIGVPVDSVLCHSVCHPVVWTKGSLAESISQGVMEKGQFGANFQFLPSVSVSIKHKEPAGSLCYH